MIGSQLEKAVIAGRERVRKDLENFNPNNGLEFDDYKGYTKGNLPGTLHDVKGTFKNEDGDKVTFRIFNPYGSRIGDEALAPPTSIGTQVKFQYEDGSGAILNGSQVPESFFDKIKANEPENSSGLR